MDDNITNGPEICPRLIQRTCGGWLAISPDGAPVRLGVTGHTEREARELFDQTLSRWREILALPEPRAE